MAPELKDMTCKQCEEVFTRDELTLNDGYCDTCAGGRCSVCREPLTEEQLDKDEIVCAKCNETMAAEPQDEGELSDEERRALAAYKKRQTYMREYNQRPNVKVYRKQYNKDRQKRDQLLIKRLKESGYIPNKNGKEDKD